jgi:thiol-disulfide isomerase/thioredoxin
MGSKTGKINGREIMVNNDSVETLATVEATQAFVAQHAAAALYFGGADCGVCQVMEPKVWALLDEEFPKIACARIATEQAAELAAQQSVFAVPTLIIFFDGRETFRYARNFSIAEVTRDIARPYSLFFE